ncbi:MAG: metallophosphoesterase [Limnochordia bacterium]
MSLIYPLALAGIYVLARGFFVEPYSLSLHHKEVSIADLPLELDGMRLLHLTDLHLRADEKYEEKLLSLVAEARPDLILLTGDYVDHPKRLFSLREMATALTATHQVVAVLGDNDLEEPAPIQRTLEEAGITVLRNESIPFHREGATLYVAGIDDPRFPSSDLAGALATTRSSPCVLLSHSAEVFAEAEAAGVDLLLCGHTHGGQVCLPYWGALYTNDRLGRRYASGLIRQGKLHIHVSTGVGYAKLPIRLFCPPEIVCLTLRSS